MDTPIHGMDMATPMHFPQQPASNSGSLPSVRVEVRNGPAKPAIYDVAGEEFLIGSVPGCDLRLPGTNLPPVVCLIARQADGVRLRKLAPTLPVLVNGQPIGQTAATTLTHGDCISIGAVDIQVIIEYSFSGLPAADPLVLFVPPINDNRLEESSRRDKDLRERERLLEEQIRELEADRILWYRRRDEIEQEMKQARQSAAQHDRSDDDLTARENRLRAREEELNRRQSELAHQQDELLKLREETLATRRELNERFTGKRDEMAKVQDSIRESLERIKNREEMADAELAARRQAVEDELKKMRERAEEELRQWHNRGASGLTNLREQIEQEVAARYRQRGEELDRFQLSLREAAVQLREHKQELDEALNQFEPRRQELLDLETELTRRREEIEFQADALQRERDALALEQRLGREPLTQKEHDLSARSSEIEYRLRQLNEDREFVDKSKSQYETDLIRLDRWQVSLDEKERLLRDREAEIDQRLEQFQKDAGELEDQVQQIDAREELIRAEERRFNQHREELERREASLNERLAQIEGQQGMLAALRTRLEQSREEQRLEASRIANERAQIEERERESKERLLEAERIREHLATEQQGYAESEKTFRERSEILQQAVQRLRDLQKTLSDEDERLRQLGEDLDRRTADLAEREAALAARTEQLVEQQHRLDADRLALKQREESFFLTEGTRESLQEQLRRRAEELMNRGQELEARATAIAEQERALQSLRAEANGHLRQVENQTAELAKRDDELREQREKLVQAEQAVAEQRKLFEEAQAAWEVQRQQAETKLAESRQEIEHLKQSLAQQAAELVNQVPDLEGRAQSALDRTTQAREALRGQLAELHVYAKQSQDELDGVRSQVQAEIDRLRQQEAALGRSRTEHRHAVASFRQQLMEWQARFSEMKQVLSHGESRIDRREKEVDATTQQLAKQAEELGLKEREVAERRGEMERHLNDMREWYRKKLRELVESRNAERGLRNSEPIEADIIPIARVGEDHSSIPNSELRDPQSPVILSMQEDLDPADRKLGELLRELELVDAETLLALWGEARRQHRPLRQVLLAGGYLTLYQLALIETGNLSGLVLGRFRVIDRLHSSPREAVYRVFDSQRVEEQGTERGICVLRHLGEMEMQDAIRPDEYRQRFRAARDLAHPNIAATWEVMEINGRPAVSQEWLRGLTSNEFPQVAGVPGVWYRLLSQAALGLHTAHQGGLIHGRLTAESLVLTRDGMLKIAGLGEPLWLHSGSMGTEPSAEDDLRALGRIVSDWTVLTPKKKGRKGLPESLLAILRGLGAETSEGVPLALYPTTAALLEDLDQASRDVPADVVSWEKLLEHVEENATEGPLLRQTA